ncbi:MAG: ketoacyl-ACP synthase III [Flavobacteriaceae bacterium]
MPSKIYSIITGTGSYIPKRVVKNTDFLQHDFYEKNGMPIQKNNQEVIDKFEEITTITERRYITDEYLTSDIAFFAAEKAIENAHIDKEELDHIIVAHNFGDTTPTSKQVDVVPSIAAKVKFLLKIKNPNCVAYDLLFGCPGWLQGMIQADYYIKAGDAKKVLVIGAETLSRISDPHDRDSMIYADGAGATILEAKESESPIGIIGHKTRTDSYYHSKMLSMGASYKNDDSTKGEIYMKMNGRRLYQYALETVPQTVKECLDAQGIHPSDVKKLLIHQANGKMDDAILQRLFKLYEIDDVPENFMPMTIAKLGNSSVATIPTLLDLIKRDKLPPHKINKGDTIVFTSVGGGMHINTIVYKV